MIILHERYVRPDGTPAQGSVSVRPRWTYKRGLDTVVNEWITTALDHNGEVVIEIPPHEPGLTDPSPVWFLVIENVPECGLRQLAFNLPAGIHDGKTLRLGDFRSMSIYSNPPQYESLGDNMFFGYGVDPGRDEYAPGGGRDGETPAIGEARFWQGNIEVWDGTTWVVRQVRHGDEYTDLLTGVVHAVNP